MKAESKGVNISGRARAGSKALAKPSGDHREQQKTMRHRQAHIWI